MQVVPPLLLVFTVGLEMAEHSRRRLQANNDMLQWSERLMALPSCLLRVEKRIIDAAAATTTTTILWRVGEPGTSGVNCRPTSTSANQTCSYHSSCAGKSGGRPRHAPILICRQIQPIHEMKFRAVYDLFASTFTTIATIVSAPPAPPSLP